MPVAGVEAPHEAHHRDLAGVLLACPCVGGADLFAAGHVQRQRFLDEQMLAGLEHLDALGCVQGRRRHQHDGIEAVDGQQLVEALDDPFHTQLIPDPCTFLLQRAGRGQQMHAGDAVAQALRMLAAQASQADDADAKHVFHPISPDPCRPGVAGSALSGMR